MSEGVRKIITVLIVMVICVVVGALVINVVAPNAVALVLNGVDRGIFNATGLKADINGDGIWGDSDTNVMRSQGDNTFAEDQAGGMEGFNEGWGAS